MEKRDTNGLGKVWKGIVRLLDTIPKHQPTAWSWTLFLLGAVAQKQECTDFSLFMLQSQEIQNGEGDHKHIAQK